MMLLVNIYIQWLILPENHLRLYSLLTTKSYLYALVGWSVAAAVRCILVLESLAAALFVNG